VKLPQSFIIYVYGMYAQSANSVPSAHKIQMQRQMQPLGSVTAQANGTSCSACSESTRVQRKSQGSRSCKDLCFIPTCFVAEVSGTLCEHKWNTRKYGGFAGSGHRRQTQVDARREILLSPSRSWRRNKEKSVLEKVKCSLLLL